MHTDAAKWVYNIVWNCFKQTKNEFCKPCNELDMKLSYRQQEELLTEIKRWSNKFIYGIFEKGLGTNYNCKYRFTCMVMRTNSKTVRSGRLQTNFHAYREFFFVSPTVDSENKLDLHGEWQKIVTVKK